MVEAGLVRALCVKLPSLGALALEVLPGGAEATAVVKLSTNCSMVVKTTHPRLAAEEVAQIERINAALPGTCPSILHAETDRGIYVTEFVHGATLEQLIQQSEDEDGSTVLKAIHPSIWVLRHLHFETRRPYESSYHETIVVKRLRSILHCRSTTDNLKRLTYLDIESYYLAMWDRGLVGENDKTLSDHLSFVVSKYLECLPETESLIHGDPHFGNIVLHQQKPVFIDPRVTWDDVENPKPGYFDPLYDIACVAHSLIANVIIERAHELVESVESRRRFLLVGQRLLDAYVGREPTEAEQVRFLTYLLCSLSGNLKYSRWTPTTETFWLTLNFLDMLGSAIAQLNAVTGVTDI